MSDDLLCALHKLTWSQAYNIMASRYEAARLNVNRVKCHRVPWTRHTVLEFGRVRFSGSFINQSWHVTLSYRISTRIPKNEIIFARDDCGRTGTEYQSKPTNWWTDFHFDVWLFDGVTTQPRTKEARNSVKEIARVDSYLASLNVIHRRRTPYFGNKSMKNVSPTVHPRL